MDSISCSFNSACWLLFTETPPFCYLPYKPFSFLHPFTTHIEMVQKLYQYFSTFLVFYLPVLRFGINGKSHLSILL
ncbi:hypothetical protein BC01_005 [Bacillus phage BC01]|nr:hypothetical protein BC01_005 [Bacillus phage BC01]